MSQRELFSLAEFGGRLRSDRKARQLTQGPYAQLAGVTLQSQSRYEQAQTEPGIGYLAALASQGVDVAWLLTGQRSAGELSPGESQWVTYWRELNGDERETLARLAELLLGKRLPSRQIHAPGTRYDPGPAPKGDVV